MRILGIETSCDDTCAALVEAHGNGKNPRFTVRANIVSSQEKTHAPFGGVVPTLAAREHAENIVPVLRRALRKSKTKLRDIDLFAVTTHPGLLPALLVGVHATRALAWLTRKPILGIDHLQGHVVANLLPSERRVKSEKRSVNGFAFPAVGLIVSGGHTQLLVLRNLLHARIVGETRDDAAGEAFDKIAKLLGLPFPGGPPIARLAEHGNAQAFPLPRPMKESADCDFSFSGLKTAVLYLVHDLKRRGPLTIQQKRDIAASFQQAAVDVLVAKTLRAAKKHRARTILLGGGVAANKELRRQLARAVKNAVPDSPAAGQAKFQIPDSRYALDNAAMIAAAAYIRWQHFTPSQRKRATWQRVRVKV